tara:strand:- start:2259 stop:2480 length:222 start_codon:yes stop_codon:yes gene_type:complete
MVKGYNKNKFKKIEKKVIEYFFTNHDNSWKTMQKKFKISVAALNRMISEELERRFENKRKIDKLNEDNKRNRN